MNRTTHLGQKSAYISQYDPNLLFPMPRKTKRDEIGIQGALPFHGADIWNAYELSWLDLKGKPHVAMAEWTVPCDSPYLVESKSIKLYLVSFNQSRFPNALAVQQRIRADLSNAAGAPVKAKIVPVSHCPNIQMGEFQGICLDDVDVVIDRYQPYPEYLTTEAAFAEETLYSNLLKSNCLVTNQPDWGSVLIRYKGRKINHEGLLKYIISLREHNEFHEQCVERIFMNILQRCKPEKLTVYARYTRRGGLDINPFRSNFEACSQNLRQIRQ